jgi:hypothetical protein
MSFVNEYEGLPLGPAPEGVNRRTTVNAKHSYLFSSFADWTVAGVGLTFHLPVVGSKISSRCLTSRTVPGSPVGRDSSSTSS